jgi:hypothetical protein
MVQARRSHEKVQDRAGISCDKRGPYKYNKETARLILKKASIRRKPDFFLYLKKKPYFCRFCVKLQIDTALNSGYNQGNIKAK